MTAPLVTPTRDTVAEFRVRLSCPHDGHLLELVNLPANATRVRREVRAVLQCPECRDRLIFAVVLLPADRPPRADW